MNNNINYLYSRPSWSDIFLNLAYTIAKRSSDAQTQHASVLTTSDNRILSLGFNGFPPKLNDINLPNLRPAKYPWMIHSEVNAVSNCKIRPEGAICYGTGPPCNPCLMHLWSNGVNKVVYPKGSYSTVEMDRIDQEVRETFLTQSGMIIDEVNYHHGWADTPAGLIWDDAARLASYLNSMTVPLRTVLVSGGFDPCHLGHLRLLQEARTLGQVLIVIVNGDGFLRRKKGFSAIPEAERCDFMAAQKGVDHVLLWDDGTQNVAGAIRALKPAVFCNGGDRSLEANTDPEERAACQEVYCRIELGVGGSEKIQSSSEILKKGEGRNRS